MACLFYSRGAAQKGGVTRAAFPGQFHLENRRVGSADNPGQDPKRCRRKELLLMPTAIATPTSYPIDPRLDYVEILRNGVVYIYELLSGCPMADDMAGHVPGETGHFIRQITQKELDPADPEVTEQMLNENHTAIICGPIQNEETAQDVLEQIRVQNEDCVIG